MFNTIKTYLYSLISVVVIGIGLYLKMLQSKVKRQERDINTLNNNINQQEEIYKDDLKRNEFNSIVITKEEEVKDTTKLNQLEKERDDKIIKNNAPIDNFTSITI